MGVEQSGGFITRQGVQHVYDPETGTSSHFEDTPDGMSTQNSGIDAGAYTKRDRYRSLGEAAANAPAYQPDFADANANHTDSLMGRIQQSQALGMQRNAAMGNAPSAAAITGNQVAGNSLAAGLGAEAGARPGGLAAAAAGAQAGQHGYQLQGQGSAMAGRSNEMGQAIGSYGAGATSMRAGDYANAGLDQGQTDAIAKSQNAQRALNQAGQMSFEQLGVNSEQQQVNDELRQRQMQTNQNDSINAAYDANNARVKQEYIAGASAIGSMGSDERMKTGVRALSFSDAAAKREAFELGVKQGAAQSQVPAQRAAFQDGADGTVGGGVPSYMWEKPRGAGPEGKAASAEMTRPAGAVPPAPAEPGYMARLAAAAHAHASAAHAALQRAPTAMADAMGRMYPETPGTLDTMAAPQTTTSDARAKTNARDMDMGKALAHGLKPYEYEYKPGFSEAEGQSSGEKNVGPMAQNMASNPITGSAVQKGGDGMLRVDLAKATKLSLGGLGYLAAQQRQQADEIAKLKGAKNGTR
jgi:hypothetical protein